MIYGIRVLIRDLFLRGRTPAPVCGSSHSNRMARLPRSSQAFRRSHSSHWANPAARALRRRKSRQRDGETRDRLATNWIVAAPGTRASGYPRNHKSRTRPRRYMQSRDSPRAGSLEPCAFALSQLSAKLPPSRGRGAPPDRRPRDARKGRIAPSIIAATSEAIQAVSWECTAIDLRSTCQ